MTKAVIFGGTAEGRKLCEHYGAKDMALVYCVATEDGASAVEALPNVCVNIGRLDGNEMAVFLRRHKPAFVIDATHPYADEASKNIRWACGQAGIRLIRVIREGEKGRDCAFYGGMDELLLWLAQNPGNVFVTTGSSAAEAFTKLADWQNRVWMRILPNLNSLQQCMDLGYRPERLICMRGPFSEGLNRAMFQSANAKILVTKDSGAAGGYAEKARAAKKLGMAVAVIARPEDMGGVSFEEACHIQEYN